MIDRVLVTGITGFIAKHVALHLLREGFHVRGTVRDMSSTDDLRKTMESNGAEVAGLSFAQADLGSDAGWEEAARECTYIQHLASPFPIAQPRDRESLVPAARQGALRVLEAAKQAQAKRIVVTSSIAAMMYGPGRVGVVSIREDDWSDIEWPHLTPYQVSKTRAEQAVWEWAEANDWKDRMVVVNPGLVLGPTLDRKIGTSMSVIQLMMQGAYPAVPPVHFSIVDVRDLASLHVRAMTEPSVAGRRLVAAGETLSMSEMGRVLREEFSERTKIPYRELPAFLVRLMSVFDRSLKSITNDLGVVPVADSAYVTELTGVEWRSAAEAVRAAGHSLVKFGVMD
ncbi:MAG: NAD-dependent epimerase/dehydratase family protein [Rhodothermia bacterium]|nr:NAD-dependent epimerase/dehydratase family protein [Rhodothermia bacterium]